jgi:GNAT superfamily N-acetyltransferase
MAQFMLAIKPDIGHGRCAAVTVSFRRAVKEDAGLLALLRWDNADVEQTRGEQVGAEFAAGFDEFVRAAVEGGAWVIWVAEHDGRVIGHAYVAVVGMVPRPGRLARKWGYVSGLYVAPEERDKGAGSGLVQQAVEWAKEAGLEFLMVAAAGGSVALYQRARFRRSADLVELEFGS